MANIYAYLACRERSILSTRGIIFHVPTLTGRYFVLVHPAQPNGRPTLTMVLLPIVIIFLFPGRPLGGGDYCIGKHDTTRQKNRLWIWKIHKYMNNQIIRSNNLGPKTPYTDTWSHFHVQYTTLSGSNSSSMHNVKLYIFRTGRKNAHTSIYNIFVLSSIGH